MWVFLALPLYSQELSAEASVEKSNELNQQIDYLKTKLLLSGCAFERNGKTYTPQEALQHINKKHRYYEDKIDSLDQFIELAASKSMMSGKAYYMMCDGLRIKSADWLHQRLLMFTD